MRVPVMWQWLTCGMRAGHCFLLQVWSSLLLMVISALTGAMTDLRFDAVGYAWQLVNCVFTSAYALYLSGAMDRVAPHTSDGKRLGEFSMVFYNNALSIGPVVLLMLVRQMQSACLPAHALQLLITAAAELRNHHVSRLSLHRLSVKYPSCPCSQR